MFPRITTGVQPPYPRTRFNTLINRKILGRLAECLIPCAGRAYHSSVICEKRQFTLQVDFRNVAYLNKKSYWTKCASLHNFQSITLHSDDRHYLLPTVEETKESIVALL
ncbi:hypothetical protein J6590_088925 [Homalodisca vitripennis]|nr:hypothetical protein J6590_088925 [Homalodisca vitripennis]